MINECDKRNIPLPNYKNDFSGFIVEFMNNTSVKDDGVSDGAIDNLNEYLRREIISMINIIASNEGINTNTIVDSIGSKSKPTVEIYLKVARKLNIIEYKGAAKTGGYFLTEEVKRLHQKTQKRK